MMTTHPRGTPAPLAGALRMTRQDARAERSEWVEHCALRPPFCPECPRGEIPLPIKRIRVCWPGHRWDKRDRTHLRSRTTAPGCDREGTWRRGQPASRAHSPRRERVAGMTPSNVRLVLGPPGTGKTTRLVQLLHDEIDAGVPTEAIAFVTFTRAARQEVRERVERCFRLSPDDLPWFRTIHSAAYRLLGLRPGDVLAAEAWAQFAGRFGYRLTTDQCSDVEADILAPPLVTADDALRALVQWSRNRRVSLDDALRQWRLHVPRSQAHVFAERLAAFRAEPVSYTHLTLPTSDLV